MSDNQRSAGPIGTNPPRKRRGGRVAGVVVAGLILSVLFFALMYVLLAGAIGFGVLAGISVACGMASGCALTFWDAAEDVLSSIGEMLVAVLAGIAAVFAAIFSIFN